MQEVTVQIDAPIEAVFQLLADREQVRRWLPELLSTETVSAGPDGGPVGGRFRHRMQSGNHISTYEGVVTAFDEPERLSVRVGNHVVLMEVDYLLSRGSGGATEVCYRLQSRVTHWLLRWFSSLFGTMTQVAMQQQMASLKRVAESDNR